jgi:membrane protease YdiL (CAAX protease family)
MKKTIDFLKAKPVITGIVAIVMGFFVLRILGTGGGNSDLLSLGMLRFAVAMIETVFLILISGGKTYEKCCKTTGYIFKTVIPIFVFVIIFVGIGTVVDLTSEKPLVSNWPVQILLSAFLCVFIGLYEETAYRAIINDALLYQFRDYKGVFKLIAVVSFLVFGAAHIIGADISTPTSLAMVVMKTVSAGMFGLILLFMYWKTRNLWGIALAHGLYDFVSIAQQAIFEGDKALGANGPTADYVVTDQSTSPIVLIVYAVMTVYDLAVAIWIWKKHMKDVDFDELRKTW